MRSSCASQRSVRYLLSFAITVVDCPQTAKGDVHGAIFNHLTAASTLLVNLLCKEKSSIPNEMRKFLVEYYTYAATLSMISINPHSSTQSMLMPELENMACELASENYVGHLCGCWLELLLLIPRIFELGCRALTGETGNSPNFPSSDDFVAFGSLQIQILSYSPNPTVNLEVSLAGRIFQKTILLYLLTIFSAFPSENAGSYSNLVSSTIVEAISLLETVPAQHRINTSLCWPIAVLGSSISDDYHQRILRTRLHTMLQSIGLGNIHRTLLLLEQMWLLPPEGRSPWTIYKSMQDHSIWISFA